MQQDPAHRVTSTGAHGRRLVAGAVTGAIAVCLVLGLGALSSSKPEAAEGKAEDRPAVIFVPAHRGKNSSELTLPASLLPLQEATLSARTSGYVKQWHAEMGDRVKAGQLLAEIEAPELDRDLDRARANLAQVKAQLDLARVTADRYRALLRDEAVAPQEAEEKTAALAAREADHAALRAQVKQLETLKSFQRVVAPFTGTITARNIEVGSLIAAGGGNGAWLFRIAQSDTLRVFVGVPQSQMAVTKAGTEAEILVRELGSKPIAATVVRNAGAFDPTTRTLLTELRVPNADGRVYPGMYGQVRFHVKYAEPPIVVPVNALLVGGEGNRVAIVDSGDAVRIRPVKLGRDLGKEIEILEGLADNDRVVSNPRDNLEDGTKVKPVPAPKHEEKKEPKKDEPKKEAAAAPPPAAPAKSEGAGK